MKSIFTDVLLKKAKQREQDIAAGKGITVEKFSELSALLNRSKKNAKMGGKPLLLKEETQADEQQTRKRTKARTAA